MTFNSDTKADRARALHRVIRAIHDGNCPKCGILVPSHCMECGTGHKCRACGFEVTAEEQVAALAEFAPFMKANVDEFERWREERKAAKRDDSSDSEERA